MNGLCNVSTVRQTPNSRGERSLLVRGLLSNEKLDILPKNRTPPRLGAGASCPNIHGGCMFFFKNPLGSEPDSRICTKDKQCPRTPSMQSRFGVPIRRYS